MNMLRKRSTSKPLNISSSTLVTEEGFFPSISEPEASIDDYEDNLPQFTWRAVIVGSFLGILISASNFYVGLRMGWTFGAGIFGSIFGFTIIKFLTKLGIGKGQFNPKEHATLCSVATAAGSGTLAGYISGIPAMYRLGLLKDIDEDLTKLFIWSIAAGTYGMFFAIPLRKWFVIKQKLPFPSPTATAEIIKSLHSVGGDDLANKKTKAMALTFLVALVFLFMAYFVPVLKSWHVLFWIAQAFPVNSINYRNLIEGAKWRWGLTLSTAFIGAGMMTPMNTHISTNFGSLLAWGIIGPLLIKNGIAPGDRHQMKGTIINGKLIGVTELPTARYWLLWPGLFMMIAGSFTELACKSGSLFKGIKALILSGRKAIFKGSYGDSQKDEDVGEIDPVPDHQQVPKRWWIPGLFTGILLTIGILSAGFDVGVGESIFAIILGFLFAFVGLQAAGDTDINPTGTIAKASQIVFATLPPHNPTGEALAMKQTANLSAGLVSASSAAQSVDMVSDLKTGHLVHASPRSQFLGQAAGSLVGAVIGLGFWKLFSTAYPCIVSTDVSADTECLNLGFGLQAVTAWQGITIALTAKNSIPSSALYTALGFGIFTVIFTIFKNFYIPRRYHNYLPNMNAVGIAFVNIDPSMFLAMMLGGIISLVWRRKLPSNHELYMYAVASGLIAAEGVFGIGQAFLSVAGIHEGGLSRFGMPPRLNH